MFPWLVYVFDTICISRHNYIFVSKNDRSDVLTSFNPQDNAMPKKNLDTGQPNGVDLLPVVTLKELRKRAGQTQDAMAVALGVGQDTISRLEKRDDMLLSTLRHYVESLGGHLSVVASLPGQAPVKIVHRDVKKNQTA